MPKGGSNLDACSGMGMGMSMLPAWLLAVDLLGLVSLMSIVDDSGLER